MSSIVIKMEGGLGNQLLQYLFGLSLASLHKNPVYFDITEYVSNRGIRKFALFELNLPGSFISCIKEFNTHRENVHLKKITFYQCNDEYPIVTSLKLEVINEKNIEFSPNNLKVDSGYFAGYWQSYKYWDNVTERLTWLNNILDDVAIKRNLKIEALDRSAIHVRRGDYLHTDNINWLGVCEEDFYREAIRILDSNTNVFFTDDSIYVDNRYSDFLGFKNISRELNNEIDEFLTIRTYQKIVISNSSYSYMAAMLASSRQQNCLVIAPYPWYSWTDIGPDLLPEWVKLNRVTGQNELQDKKCEALAQVIVIAHVKKCQSSINSTIDMLSKQTLKPCQVFMVYKDLDNSRTKSTGILDIKTSDLQISILPKSENSQTLNSLIEQTKGNYVAILNEDEVWHEEKLRYDVHKAIKLSADIVLDSIYELLSTGHFLLPPIYENINSIKTLNKRIQTNLFLNKVSIFTRKEVITKTASQLMPLPIADQQISYELAAMNYKKIVQDKPLVWLAITNLNQKSSDLYTNFNYLTLQKIILDKRIDNDVLLDFFSKISPLIKKNISIYKPEEPKKINAKFPNLIKIIKLLKSLIKH